MQYSLYCIGVNENAFYSNKYSKLESKVWTSSFESIELNKEIMDTERRNIERPIDGRMTLVLGLFDL